MFYVIFDDQIYTLFINQESCQYNIQQNYFNFDAVSMIGVVILYSNNKPVRINNNNNTQTIVPRNMALSVSSSYYQQDSI